MISLRSKLALAAVLMIASLTPGSRDVCAQWLPEHSFLEFRLQSNQYSGERGLSTQSGVGGLASRFGPGMALTAGYMFGSNMDLGLRFESGTYPGILRNGSGRPKISASQSSSSRKSLSLVGRYYVFSILKIKPFATVGLGTAFGKLNGFTESGTGPIVGIGATYTLFGLSFYSALDHHFVYPDEALDLAGSSDSPDALTTVSLGIRYTFKKNVPRLGSVVVTGPSVLTQGFEGVFQVDLEEFSPEVEIRWDFGEGNMDSGPVVRRAWREPGLYPVTVTVSGQQDRVQRTLNVQVTKRFAPVDIIAIEQTPRKVIVGDDVGFVPRIRGEDYTCRWDFGDGISASECEVRHVFSDAGSYLVNLRVSNPEFSSRSTREVVVRDDACLDLPALHAVYFEFNSSELTTEMRTLLRENLATASACPNMLLIVQGGAHPSEPRTEVLARERASVVVQYYLNLGMSSHSVSVSDDVIIREQRDRELAWPLRLAASFLQSN